MPSTWVGCTIATTVRGDLTGGQAKVRGTAFKGTTSVLITATVQGCERTGANIKATPRQSLTHLPWTASGSETSLLGKISFPDTAEISPGTAWAFDVRTP